MKPPVALLLAPALGSLCAAGQGHLALANRVVGEGLDAPVLALDCQTRLSGSEGYLAQLYVGVDSAALQPLQPTSPFRGGAAAGYVNAVNVMVPLQIAPDLDSRVWVQLRVWSTRDAATFEEAQARGAPVGQSAVFQVQPAWPLHPPAHLGGLQSFCLVPEPGAGALLAAGTAAWALTRAGRRRA
jgi:hypothetical protein